MKNLYKILATVTIMVCLVLAANAQPGSTTGGFEDEPQDVPIDGGLSILVLAGAAYGFKVFNNKRDPNKTTQIK